MIDIYEALSKLYEADYTNTISEEELMHQYSEKFKPAISEIIAAILQHDGFRLADETDCNYGAYLCGDLDNPDYAFPVLYNRFVPEDNLDEQQYYAYSSDLITELGLDEIAKTYKCSIIPEFDYCFTYPFKSEDELNNIQTLAFLIKLK